MKVQLSYKALVDGFTLIERSILITADSLQSVAESKDSLVALALKKEFPGKKYDLLFSVAEAVSSTPAVRQTAVAEQPRVSKAGRPSRKEAKLVKEIWNGLETRKHEQYRQLKQAVTFDTFESFAKQSESLKDLIGEWRISRYHQDERPCLFLPDGVPATLDNTEFVHVVRSIPAMVLEDRFSVKLDTLSTGKMLRMDCECESRRNVKRRTTDYN